MFWYLQAAHVCVSWPLIRGLLSPCRFGKSGYGLSLKRYGPLPILKVWTLLQSLLTLL